MKNYKLFVESAPKFGPQVGDYVICQYKSPFGFMQDKFNKRIANKIGKIMDINTGHSYTSPYRVHFKDDIKGSLLFDREDIVAYSKNIKDLELIVQAQKYNL